MGEHGGRSECMQALRYWQAKRRLDDVEAWDGEVWWDGEVRWGVKAKVGSEEQKGGEASRQTGKVQERSTGAG